MKRTFRTFLLLIAATASTGYGQTILQYGKASIASQPPSYGVTQDAGGNWSSEAIKMLGRKIYADETADRPIPTNDWWTDVLNSRYSGALWSYPAMVNTSAKGVEICFPTYWADAGKEVKSRSSVTVGGVRFAAEATIAADWHDWDVVLRQPDATGEASLKTTLAHGMPFTWFEMEGIRPQLTFNIRAVDTSVSTAYPRGTAPEVVGSGDGYVGIRFGEELYGFYFPSGATYTLDASDAALTFDDEIAWLSVGLLNKDSDLRGYELYAVSIPRDTRVSWTYDESQARVDTHWDVTAENLRDSEAPTSVLQGFLPHVWKHALAGASLPFNGDSYLTPRGTMKMAASSSGSFAYSYRFSGMMPTYAAPHVGDHDIYGYRPEVMDALMQTYADRGTFGDDTYWGGKGLTQMALNMTFAKQTGNTAVYEQSKRRLREVLSDWLTYTPGEKNYYFSYYPRWGGMLGFAVSYGSDTFNDHHFHFGYFTYAAALLCMEDKDFAADYGEALTLLAKDYANWDRSDSRFPFLRTLDIWEGHSWAGGLGDAGNDNGNGQESTSEAMQAWGGVYLLGVALGNKEMRDAGLFGWNTEARATREYWFDPDSERPANAGGRKAWAGKGLRQGTYDYSLYPYAYNSNLTGKGIGWWTWFGGDPLFMHGIQWMPISPALDYLSWDTDFVAWAYDDMMRGANSTFSHSWFEDTTNSADGSTIEALAKNDWGNVTLAYLQRADAASAASVFDRAWEEGLHIAHSVSTSHISYYTIHNTLTYGNADPAYYADCPTASVHTKDGRPTFMAYNPGTTDLTVNFYGPAGKAKTVKVAPGRLTAFDRGDAIASKLTLSCEGGCIIPPGETSVVSARVTDQYDAGVDGVEITWTLSPGAPASIGSDGRLTIDAKAPKGSSFTATGSGAGLSESITITVNDRPEAVSALISGFESNVDNDIATFELGTSFSPSLVYTDQYGTTTSTTDARWSCTHADGTAISFTIPFTPAQPGTYTITATSDDKCATATASIFITPMMSVISDGAAAVSSSEENAGSLTSSVNDGSAGTRWGSAHTESEWVYLDLGADRYVSRVGILWEAAYASEYAIELAPDGCAMSKHTGNYAGAERSFDVPADQAWSVAAVQTQASHSTSEISTVVNATGRYVRMRGISRALPYGYSIYEMRVYGLKDRLTSDTPVGIGFDLPQAATQGETIQLTATCFMGDGSTLTNPSTEWSADKEARFEGNAFTPLSHGTYTVSASLGDLISSASIFVYEKAAPARFTFTPSSTSIIESERCVLNFELYDQFDCIYPISDDSLRATVTDSEGNVTDGASYDIASRTFSAACAGEYILHLVADGIEGTATVSVKAVSEANLALNRTATASSTGEGNTPELICDGNTATRWSSSFDEGQWVALDLGRAYLVDRFEIVWENAFARSFHIDASLDGENWRTIHTDSNCPGGLSSIELPSVYAAKYLRLVCDRRAMEAYGVSIYEWEVYGTGYFDAEDDGSSPEIDAFDLSAGNGILAVNAKSTDKSGTVYYCLTITDATGADVTARSGTALSGESFTATITDLPAGDYVVALTAENVFGHRTSTTGSATVEIMEGGINIAAGKSVMASSEQGAYVASNLTDGTLDSRWSSAQGNDDTEPWVMIDLGSTFRIFRVHLFWENAYATDFDILVGDTPGNLSTVASRRGFTLGATSRAIDATPSDMINFNPVCGRYLKLQVNRKYNAAWGASLHELEAFGDTALTGVDIPAAGETEELWYSLQGFRVSRPAQGIYIRVKGGIAERVYVR